MKNALALGVLPALAVLLSLAVVSASRSAEKTGPKLAHMVFFTLKDHTPEARAKLVASCHKYLDGHEGALYFSVGTIAEDVREPVSVRDFDVALHLVFEDKDAAAQYQKHPRHVAFVAENKESFASVRVFDSYLTTR